MSLVRNLLSVLGAAALLCAAPMAAHAADCLTLTPSPATITGTIDPFGSSGQITGTLTMTATIHVDPSENKVNEADLIFIQPTGDNTAYQITFNGQNVLYAAGAHTITTGSSSGQVLLNEPGASATFTISVTIPAGANLTAGTNTITFPVQYVCKETPGDAKFPGTLANGLVVQFTVPAALQASFAGTAMDFGDITLVTNGQASSHIINGQINVKSTAPYTVAVSSSNGFVMTPGGTGASAAAQKIGYQWGLLSQSAGGASGGVSTTWTSKSCTSAGLSGVSLPLTTTLNEGGQGKVNGSYKDTVQVTFTPLVTPPPSVSSCP